jgi:hypothetical protein
MPDEIRYGISPKSGRNRHYHTKPAAVQEPETPKETAADRIKRQFEGISAEQRKQMYHDAMGKKKVGSQYRAEEGERQRIAKEKQDAYDNSFVGKAHNFGKRIKEFGGKVIGGIANAFKKGKDIATTVGRGAYHVGRDVVHLGRDVGRGLAKTYRGARSVYRGTKRAAHAVGDAVDYLSNTPASQMAEDTYNGIRKYGGKAAGYVGEQGSKLAKAAAKHLYDNSDSVRGAYDAGENVAKAAKKGYKYMKNTSYGQMGKDAYSGAKKGVSSLASAAYNLFSGKK